MVQNKGTCNYFRRHDEPTINQNSLLRSPSVDDYIATSQSNMKYVQQFTRKEAEEDSNFLRTSLKELKQLREHLKDKLDQN